MVSHGLSEWLYPSHNTCLQTFHLCPGESLTTFYHSGIALVGIWNESSCILSLGTLEQKFLHFEPLGILE
jgi:hypothetical protein